MELEFLKKQIVPGLPITWGIVLLIGAAAAAVVMLKK